MYLGHRKYKALLLWIKFNTDNLLPYLQLDKGEIVVDLSC